MNEPGKIIGSESADDSPLYVAIRFQGETIVGQVAKEHGEYKESEQGVTLTRVHRIIEIPLPERGHLGQVKISPKTSVLSIIPTIGLGTGNMVYVSFQRSHWRTTLTAEQWNDLVQSIQPVGYDPTPEELAAIGRGHKQ